MPLAAAAAAAAFPARLFAAAASLDTVSADPQAFSGVDELVL